MVYEIRFKHTVIVLLEGRSYGHLFGEFPTLKTDENPDLWPQEMLTGDHSKNESLKKSHSKKTLPVLTTLFEEYASIPKLNLVKKTDSSLDVLKQIFGEKAELLSEVESKLYTYLPSVLGTLNTEIEQHQFDQFFVDVENKKLPLLSVIEANSAIDGQGWSMATGGNSLNYAEEKILQIYNSINEFYYDKTNILFLWTNNGGLPDNTSVKRLANIWVSPYFTRGKKIYDFNNKNFTPESIHNFLNSLYNGVSLNTASVGNLWQPNLLTETFQHKQLLKLKANQSQYNYSVSPYKMGHPRRIKGSAERYYENIYGAAKLQEHCENTKLTLKDTSEDAEESNAKVGFWLIFSAVVLWFILILGLLYVYIKKYSVEY